MTITQTHACLVKSTGAQSKTTFNFKCVFILELKRDAYITFEEKQSAYPQKKENNQHARPVLDLFGSH